MISIPSSKVGLVMSRGGAGRPSDKSASLVEPTALPGGEKLENSDYSFSVFFLLLQVDKNVPDRAREKNIVIKGRPANVQKAKVNYILFIIFNK